MNHPIDVYPYAVEPDDMKVKLRDRETKTKLPRTPFNLVSAVSTLCDEMLGLEDNNEMLGQVFRIVLETALSEREWATGDPNGDVTVMAVEFLIHQYGVKTERSDPGDVAITILGIMLATFEDRPDVLARMLSLVRAHRTHVARMAT